jgi:hypothetical protein
MATSSPVALFNTDPNVQAQAALLQQRQAMAQALMEQGMKPLDTNNRTVGGVGYNISPMEGLAKMLQAYSGRNGLEDTTQQQAGLASQAYAALLNKYQPGTDPSYSDAQRQGAESAGMPGPGTDGMGPPDPQKMAAALMTQQPAQGGQNPNNPNGIPSELIAGYTAGMVPKEVFEAQAARYKPTDATVQALQGGMDPAQANRTKFAFDTTDPKVRAMQQAGFSPQQIYAAQYAESAKAGDIERRPGQSFQNSFTGQAGITPTIPPNANPVGVPGPNGAIPGVTPIPGAAPVVQGNAQSQSTGTSNGGFQNVTMPDGSQRPIRGTEVPALNPQPGVQGSYRGNPAEIAQAIAEIKDPQQRANAQAALEEQIRREGNPVQLGQSTAAKAGQEAGAKLMNELPVQLQQSKQTVTGLENAYKTIDALGKSGPGVSKTVNALAIVNNMGIPLMQGDTNGYQTLKKFLENSASTAAASNGFTGSDARFEQFKNGQPNAETMNPDALKGAIRYVLSQHDAAISRAQFIQQAAQANPNDPNAVQKAQQQWAKTYNPRYFEAQRMAPEDQRAMVGKMSPQEAQAFLAWRKANRAQ